MNYQMLLECHAAGTIITKQEAAILDLELDSQIASIKVSRTQGCIEVAPDHICETALVNKGSLWISCFASVLEQINPVPIGEKARGAMLIDTLVENGYVVIN